jgi:ribosomal protein S18 acetylase RimI-like enzyme
MAIRLLVDTDLPAYKALRDEGLRSAPEAFTSDFASSKDTPFSAYASRLGSAASGRFVLGAFNESCALIGIIALERETRLHTQHRAKVVGMVVAADAQKQGIATQLVAQCVHMALTLTNLEQLLLTVTASNRHVVRLYKRAGFVDYGLHPKAIKIGNLYFDKMAMRLELKR